MSTDLVTNCSEVWYEDLADQMVSELNITPADAEDFLLGRSGGPYWARALEIVRALEPSMKGELVWSVKDVKALSTVHINNGSWLDPFAPGYELLDVVATTALLYHVVNRSYQRCDCGAISYVVGTRFSGGIPRSLSCIVHLDPEDDKPPENRCVYVTLYTVRRTINDGFKRFHEGGPYTLESAIQCGKIPQQTYLPSLIPSDFWDVRSDMVNTEVPRVSVAY